LIDVIVGCCGLLWFVVVCCGLLWLALVGCGWLVFLGLCSCSLVAGVGLVGFRYWLLVLLIMIGLLVVVGLVGHDIFGWLWYGRFVAFGLVCC
jgi:hypothetical protein